MPEIDPEQAETVRYIYRAFLEGKAPSYIARDLTARGILTPGGKTTWRANTVMSILTNEKYKGDALLQKTFCTDFLTKAYKVNEGEVPQYYVEHSHPAIIDRAMFDAVQIEMKKRAEPGQRTYTPYTLSGKIYCAECGARYGSKMRRGKQSWRCNNRHLGRTNCTAPVLHTETIEDAFVTAFNQVIERKDEIIRICMDTMTTRCDVSGIDARLATLNAELEQFSGLFLDLQNKASHGEISTKPLDLRGMIAGIRTIRSGLKPANAIRIGVLNKCFDPYEKELLEDAANTRIPADWTRRDVFED